MNVYEFDKEKAVSEYCYRFFPAYDEKWMDFIVSSQICILNQEVANKYLKFIESKEL